MELFQIGIGRRTKVAIRSTGEFVDLILQCRRSGKAFSTLDQLNHLFRNGSWLPSRRATSSISERWRGKADEESMKDFIESIGIGGGLLIVFLVLILTSGGAIIGFPEELGKFAYLVPILFLFIAIGAFLLLLEHYALHTEGYKTGASTVDARVAGRFRSRLPYNRVSNFGRRFLVLSSTSRAAKPSILLFDR